MPGIGMVIVAMLFIGIATSTRQGRAEARQKLRKYNRAALIGTLIIWTALLAGAVV